MAIGEIDFELIEDKASNKVFKFTNADGSVYDMTGSTAKCKLYLNPTTPEEINCSIIVATGEIIVPFTTTHTDNQGTFEYIIEETKVALDVIPLVKGNVIILPYTPFSESIEAYINSELPANLTLTMDFRNQKIIYWRRILQEAFEINDADLNIESKWPELVNALLAKLVVHDAIELAMKGSFIQFLGGNFTDTTTIGGGGLKAVETGPTRVEYYDTATSVKNAFSSTQGGISMFDALGQSICGLANFLKIKLPMCEGNKVVIVPKYYENPNWVGTEITEI